MGLTRAQWYDQSRILWVKAYNLVGTETADVDVVRPNPARPAQGRAGIIAPGASHQRLIDGTTAPAGTTLKTRVYAVEYPWKCASEAYNPANVPPGLEYVDCADARQQAQRVRLYLGTTLVEDYVPADGEFSRELTVDLAGKSVGEHTLMTIVTLSDGTTLSNERSFTLKQGAPLLNLERSAERRGHYFLVSLTLHNTGSGSAYVDYIDDYARGFQVFHMDELEHRVRLLGVEILVLTLVAEAAQAAVDRAVKCGITAILNFVPVRLVVPPYVKVHYVDLSIELESLAFYLP